jgi:hypothetical protein
LQVSNFYHNNRHFYQNRNPIFVQNDEENTSFARKKSFSPRASNKKKQKNLAEQDLCSARRSFFFSFRWEIS